MLNFAVWDGLLHRYVDSQGRVDYKTWQKQDRATLSVWLASMGQVNLREATPAQGLAFWINLYNALVIAQILRRDPLTPVLPQVFGLPNWPAFLWFFSRPVYRVAGESYSLNRIEHGTIRQQFAEPRIHFALVCAAIGCPLLRNEAYRPESVYDQLEADAQRFITNPDKVRYDSTTGTLYCSRIFKWYGQDFLKLAPSISAYLQPYLKQEFGREPTIVYLDYDWGLNQRISS